MRVLLLNWCFTADFNRHGNFIMNLNNIIFTISACLSSVSAKIIAVIFKTMLLFCIKYNREEKAKSPNFSQKLECKSIAKSNNLMTLFYLGKEPFIKQRWFLYMFFKCCMLSLSEYYIVFYLTLTITMLSQNPSSR